MRKLMSAVAVFSLLGFSSAVLAGEIGVFIAPPQGVVVETENVSEIFPDVAINVDVGEEGIKEIAVMGPSGVEIENVKDPEGSLVENTVTIGISPGTPF